MKKFIAATVSTFIFLSPGFRAGQAFAQVIAPNAAQGASVGVMTVPAGIAGVAPAGASASVSLSAPNLSAPSLLGTVPSVTPAPAVRASAAQASALALPAASAQTPAARAQAASAKAVGAAAVQTRAAAAASVGSMSKQVSAAVESVGPVAAAAPSDAHALGGRLEAVLNGTRRASAAAAPVAPENGDWQGLSHDRYFGKPAGYESIAGAVRAHNSRFAAAPETPAPAPQDEVPAPRREKAPFFPKLISAGLALVPAVAIGWPLLAAGSLLAGGSVIAASAVLMALPFMGENTPAFLRALPGAAVLGLGGLTLFTALTAGGSLWMGSFVALGGWGLLRYGLKTNQEDRYDREKALSAYFGSVGAVLGAGLALAAAAAVLPLAAPAWLVTGAAWAAYPLTALLFMHLPGWVGEGISSALRAAYTSGRAVHRVLGSLKRDTVMYDRLTAFTKRHLQSSPWNAIWLSGIWIPVWVSEAAMALLSVAAGLAFGAAMAPSMFAWGAVHKLWEKSAATKFLGAWNHFLFDWAQGSKIAVYNRAAKPLVAVANKNHGVVSIGASLGLRVLQLAWLAYAVVGFPIVAAIGFMRAFGKTSGDYDYKRHSPDYLRVDTNDRPDVERPDEPEEPGKPGKKSTWIPRLVASGIAVLPLYFLALPLIGAPVVGQLFALTGLALAVMPFMPAATPKYLKQVPGTLLIGLGLATSLAVPYFLFGEVGMMVVAGSNAFWMGLVTALSGWGMVRYIGTLGQKEGQKWYSVDDPEYIGAFFGALGVLTGLGVSLMGMTGWLPLAFKVGGYLTSLLLLMHLPEWVGKGLKSSAEGVFASAKAFSRVASFWERDTDFYKNLRRHASYWLDKSVWNGSWLSVIWVPTAALMLAEWAVSAVLGLAAGLLRAPLNFLWGAAYKVAPESKFTRFTAGFVRSTFERAEGSKKTVFDRWVAPLVPTMNEANPVSGRPTLKAAFAFLVARLAQLAWLARLVFWAPAILILSVFDGVKNASGEKKQPGEDEYGDRDNPGHIY